MTRAGNVLGAAAGAPHRAPRGASLGALVCVVVVGLLAAGCSSDEAAPATTIVEPATVETTSPPPTINPPTTEPTTTLAPTTTLDPTAALAAQVEADFLEADRLGARGVQDPFNAEKEDAALDRRLGVHRRQLQRNRLLDYRSSQSCDPPERGHPRIGHGRGARCSVGADTMSPRSRSAKLTRGFSSRSAPARTARTQSSIPDVVSYRLDFFLRNVDGVWKVEGGNEIARWDEVATACAAEYIVVLTALLTIAVPHVSRADGANEGIDSDRSRAAARDTVTPTRSRSSVRIRRRRRRGRSGWWGHRSLVGGCLPRRRMGGTRVGTATSAGRGTCSSSHRAVRSGAAFRTGARRWSSTGCAPMVPRASRGSTRR